MVVRTVQISPNRSNRQHFRLSKRSRHRTLVTGWYLFYLRKKLTTLQMAWGDTIHVGCGIAHGCTLGELPGEFVAAVVCDYDPP